MNLFIDSSAFVALNNRLDGTHQRAVELNNSLVGKEFRFFTSNFVISESLTMIAQKVSLERAVRFKEEDFRDVDVVKITEAHEDQAFEIFKHLTSKNISFVDCTSFAVMRSLGITTVFSFDEHFKKMGFKMLQ